MQYKKIKKNNNKADDLICVCVFAWSWSCSDRNGDIPDKV